MKTIKDLLRRVERDYVEYVNMKVSERLRSLHVIGNAKFAIIDDAAMQAEAKGEK